MHLHSHNRGRGMRFFVGSFDASVMRHAGNVARRVSIPGTPRAVMDAYSDLLLEIYRTASLLPADEFPDAMMSLVRAVIDFDAARLLSTDLECGTALVKGSIMYNIPVDNALDWQEIQRKDLVLPHVLAHRGMPLSFNSPVLFARPEHAIIRDYANRYGHQNGLVMVLDDPDTGHTDGLSFYRNDRDAHFDVKEMRLMQALMPHLQEAIKLNRRLAESSSSARDALIIAQPDGAIRYWARQAQLLLATEWPAWQRERLPAPLLSALARPGSTGFTGRELAVTCKFVGSLLFLRIAARSPLARLSPRELEVASLYARGMAAKSIARNLSIAPATARNLLQRIYQKLDIHDKASLANLVRQQS